MDSSLYHMGNLVPCRYFNAYHGACLNHDTCAYRHSLDDFSLRLSNKVPAANICEAWLVRVGGCANERCLYSHDLEEDSDLPVDDIDALRGTLEMLIAMRKTDRRALHLKGDMVKKSFGGQPVVKMFNKPGDIILRELGGRRPGDDQVPDIPFLPPALPLGEIPEQIYYPPSFDFSPSPSRSTSPAWSPPSPSMADLMLLPPPPPPPTRLGQRKKFKNQTLILNAVPKPVLTKAERKRMNKLKREQKKLKQKQI